MMTQVFSFLKRTHGKNGPNLLDYLSYTYLFLGFLIIFLPVLWLGTNSLKSKFLIESLDTRLLPYEYKSLARASVYDENGKEILYIQGLPKWVMEWGELDDAQRQEHDKYEFLEKFEGAEYYALRSHLGIANEMARAIVIDNGLPDWVIKYASMFDSQKANYDPTEILESLPYEERRVLYEFLNIKPFKPNGFTSQILLSAPDPVTGEQKQYAVSRLNFSKKTVRAKSVAEPALPMVVLPSETVVVEKTLAPSWTNYSDPISGKLGNETFDAVRCFNNSVFVTIVATIITVLINSMAAFALSKYRFNGQIVFFIIILATLMVPASVLMVGIFKMVNSTGMNGSLWGVIIPACATPAGVFMLRQYMLTIPDELLDAARMDAASEWGIYWRIIFPLALPAIAVLTILSIIWRWNDLIHPMIAVSTNKAAYTIQMCLLSFTGEHVEAEHYRLAMTVLSLVPTTLVFVFLQKFVTTGIANTGIK